jgi:hypothetical protein
MSKVLKKRLDELETILYLLDEIPESYQSQDKMDLRKAAINAMDITDKLIERLDPAFNIPYYQDRDGNECDYREHVEGARREGSRVIRHFNVDMKSYLPGITNGRATIKVSYEPTDEEIEFIRRINEHQYKIDEIRNNSERPHRLYSAKEFNDIVIPKLKARGTNFKYDTEFIIGDPIDGLPSEKDSIDQFHKIDDI